MYHPAEMPMPKRRSGELERKPPHYRPVYDHQVADGWYPDDARYRELMASYYAEMSFLDAR